MAERDEDVDIRRITAGLSVLLEGVAGSSPWVLVALFALWRGTINDYLQLLNTLAGQNLWSFWLFVVVTLGPLALFSMVQKQRRTIRDQAATIRSQGSDLVELRLMIRELRAERRALPTSSRPQLTDRDGGLTPPAPDLVEEPK